VTPHPETIRRARESAGLTQAQAAQVVGLSTACWSSYEQGRIPIPRVTWHIFRFWCEDLSAPPLLRFNK
jgi:transcriptional regulator with XRE-family HTH domain